MAERSVIPIEENQHSVVAKICNPRTWRLANVVMALFFALAAYVQTNDPDPVIWVLMYAIPCLLCMALVADSSLQDHFLWKLTAAIHLGVCIVGVIYSLTVLLSSETGSKNLLKSEEGREIAGLLIVVFWLILCQVTKLKSFKENTAYLWTATVAISVVPFVLWSYYTYTLDVSSLQSHCKDIMSRYLFRQSEM
ncbi:transmembrane protein 220-like isoform X1 [Porites lutea]|uniref:transmembrane protein 220-like isoform X1 n=1 Tax=Porites lutea TaxID=51062 RepID=UPI003CC613A8